MVKQIARIIVTIIIMGSLGYAGYVFFFKPNNDEFVYQNLIEVIHSTSSEGGIVKTLEELEARNYFGATKSSENEFKTSNAQHQEIIKIRNFMFVDSASTIADFYPAQANSFLNTKSAFTNIGSIVKQNLEMYAAYTQFAENVTDLQVESFKDLTKILKQKEKEVKDQVNVILTYQKSNTPNVETVNSTLTGFYKSLLNKLSDYYKVYSDLADETRLFVITKVTSNFDYDVKTIFIDSALSMLKEYTRTISFTNVDFKDFTEENKDKNLTLAESYLMMETYEAFEANPASKSATINIDFTNAYNNLIKKYSTILFGINNVYSKTYETKVKILQNDADTISQIAVAYLSDVQTLLLGLGYTA